MLFRPGAPCELYKRPQKVHDFKTKVLTAMWARYERVSGPGSHSNSCNPSDHEDLSSNREGIEQGRTPQQRVGTAQQRARPTWLSY